MQQKQTHTVVLNFTCHLPSEHSN